MRRRAGAAVVDNFFYSLATLGRLHPRANPARHRVEVVRDIPYLPTGHVEHRLDVYRPLDRGRPLPVILYIHGGGFRILSKDTHWMMGIAFARRGYVVFNVSYRLAPRHRFPAAHQDVCDAYRFVLEQTHRWGGDPSRVIVAGESAGANLALSLTLATCTRRPEPWARDAFELGRPPDACLPACGIFQVSDGHRYARRTPPVSRFELDRITEVAAAYLGSHDVGHEERHALADPLVLLERAEGTERPLPPMLLTVGTRDPLIDDTRRLEAALQKLGVTHQAHYYDGELHAFHAFVWRQNARRCWGHTFSFLESTLSHPHG